MIKVGDRVKDISRDNRGYGDVRSVSESWVGGYCTDVEVRFDNEEGKLTYFDYELEVVK